tara:strand:+ start:204 stop:593 length:390 start_codon:yes stop_codon:yes gene_type:complete
MRGGPALYGILATDAGVLSVASNRIFPEIAAQGSELPLVVYRFSNLIPSDTKSGVSTLDSESYVIVAIAKSYTVSTDLSDKIRTALDRYSGTVNSVEVQSIEFTGYDSDYDADNAVYTTVTEFTLRIKI